jgi:hypothetical protein
MTDSLLKSSSNLQKDQIEQVQNIGCAWYDLPVVVGAFTNNVLISEQLINVVNEVLDYSTIKEGKMKLHEREVHEILERLVDRQALTSLFSSTSPN